MKKIFLTAITLSLISVASSFAETDTVSTINDKFDISSSSLYVPGYFPDKSGVTFLMSTLFDNFPDAYDTEKNVFRLDLLELASAYQLLNPNDQNKAAQYATKVLENQATLSHIHNSVKTDVDISNMTKSVPFSDFNRIFGNPHNEIKLYSDFKQEVKEAIVAKYCPYDRIWATFICPDTFTCKGLPVQLSEEDKYYLCHDDITTTSGTPDGGVIIRIPKYKK